MKLLLFDIDGTLIHSGGAGKRTMNLAFEQVFGVANALDHIQLAGCTDLAIVDNATKKFGINHNQHDVERFRTVYFELIKKEIMKSNPEMRIMPGVRRLLDELKQKENVHTALLTGNWEYSGRIKLSHFGLSDYFDLGAFADDSVVRNELLPFALKRFAKKYGLRLLSNDVFVIGDTYADIDCAHAHQANAVAVATGPFSVQELYDHQADFVFEDLSNTKEVIQVLG